VGMDRITSTVRHPDLALADMDEVLLARTTRGAQNQLGTMAVWALRVCPRLVVPRAGHDQALRKMAVKASGLRRTSMMAVWARGVAV
jgi:hypothetical protein